jgi:LasA protease
MDRSLKPGTVAKKKIRSNVNRLAVVLVGLAWLFSILSCNLSAVSLGQAAPPDPTDQPTPTFIMPVVQSTAYFMSTQPVATSSPVPTATKSPPVLYNAQSGDSLQNLEARFNVKRSDITSPDPIVEEGFLKVGQLLFIPRNVSDTNPTTLLLPDSEVVYSPSTIDFDISAFVKQANGYLSGFSDYTGYGMLTGALDVLQVAIDNSINPRLLLALLEYQGHWVYEQPTNLADQNYPLGNYDVNTRGLFNQLSWAARQLDIGYYGWRSGTLTEISFPDNTKVRLAPELNAGTVALEYFFSQISMLRTRRDWDSALYGGNSFSVLYDRMYGNVWVRSQAVEPLFPDNLAQPVLDLPFYPGQTWSFSGGPHAVWGTNSPFAAVDFAPGSTASGCVPSEEFVLAPAAGVVVRSSTGIVVLDLDGDGHEQTGWVLFFLHIRTDGRAYVGQRLNKDDPIGHPSCEGGNATGTHVHFARKYNGEWMLADGPLPMVLSGWRVHAGVAEYKGTLTKNDQTITADTNGSNETTIVRPNP